MTISPSDIKKLAHLARLAISDDDIAPLTSDLDKILELVEKMNQEDTRQTEPLSHPFDATQPLRADTISETKQRALLQSLAPEIKAVLYIVPQFIETE